VRRTKKTSRAAVLAVAIACVAAASCGTRQSDGQIRAATSFSGVKGGAGSAASAGGTAADPGSTDSSATGASGADAGLGGSGGGATSAGGAVTGGAGGTTGSGGGGGGAASAASGGAGPATGSEVAIGVLGTFSGPVGAFTKDLAFAIQVWGKYVNDHGGLNGHRVKVIVAEDGGSPARFNSLAQDMVENQHVLAFAMTTMGFAPGGNNSYLDSKHVVTFGTEGGLDNAYSDVYMPTAQPTGHTNSLAYLHAFAQVLIPQNKKKIAVLSCSDFSLCDTFGGSWSGDVSNQLGFQTVYRAKPSLTTPDFTGICLASKDAGAQAILAAVDTASYIRLANDCARQNYHPTIAVCDLLALPQLAVAPNMEGAVVGNKMAAFTDMSSPGIKQMYDAFARYAPGSSPSGSSASGWLQATFLTAAAAHLPANPTPDDFYTGLNQIKGNNLLGMTYPLSFTTGQPSQQKVCWSAIVVHDQKYQQAPGPNFQCA